MASQNDDPTAVDSLGSSGGANETPEQAAARKREWLLASLRHINAGRRAVKAPDITLSRAREVWVDWTRAHPDLPALAYDARVLHATFRAFETLENTESSTPAENIADPIGEAPLPSPPPTFAAPAPTGSTMSRKRPFAALAVRRPSPINTGPSHSSSPPLDTPSPQIIPEDKAQSSRPPPSSPQHVEVIIVSSDCSAPSDAQSDVPSPTDSANAHVRLRGRKARRAFTDDEDDAIIKGVQIFGAHDWRRILAVYRDRLRGRDNINIKDRYRVLKKLGRV